MIEKRKPIVRKVGSLLSERFGLEESVFITGNIRMKEELGKTVKELKSMISPEDFKLLSKEEQNDEYTVRKYIYFLRATERFQLQYHPLIFDFPNSQFTRENKLLPFNKESWVNYRDNYYWNSRWIDFYPESFFIFDELEEYDGYTVPFRAFSL